MPEVDVMHFSHTLSLYLNLLRFQIKENGQRANLLSTPHFSTKFIGEEKAV